MKTYKIAGQDLSLTKTTLKDYKEFNKILKEIGGINTSFDNDGEMLLAIGEMFNKLLDADLVEKFLKILFKKDLDYSDIDDTTLVEVLKDFFYDKKQLLESLTGSFGNSQISKSEPTET